MHQAFSSQPVGSQKICNMESMLFELLWFEQGRAETRAVTARWPHTLVVRGIRTVDMPQVQGWRREFHRASELIVGGGFPCRDISGLNADRAGLKDAHSGLVELVRVIALVRTVLDNADPRLFSGNVASAEPAVVREINEMLDLMPAQLCPSTFDCVQGPRL